jgi:hypothetical protein
VADPALFEAYFNQRRLGAPAFNYEANKGFIPTENTKQIVNKFKGLTGKDLDIRPANSVMAIAGAPVWGSGSGFAPYNEKNVGYVDPFMGTAHVVAHEGAHALMPSLLNVQNRQGLLQTQINPLAVPRDTGQRLRYVHETLAKPTMEEEANAQGVAYGLLNKLGISSKENYASPIDYPATYLDEGLGLYAKTEMGPPTFAERKEIKAIMNSTEPFLQRIFQRGYNLVK